MMARSIRRLSFGSYSRDSFDSIDLLRILPAMLSKDVQNRPAGAGALSSQEVALPSVDVKLAVSELLGRPYSRSTYQKLFLSKPERLPEHLIFPNRRRPALEKALAFAFSQPDPVRQLVVFVRAYALMKSGPEYAAELGLKPHSYSQLEARGFDPQKSVASTFGIFLRDWEKRARANPEAAPFFRWAQSRLERLLIGSDIGTPLGFLIKCQNRVGTKRFAEATGLRPETLSQFRSLNKNITFAEMLSVVDALSSGKRSRTSSMWEHPMVVEARRIFLHHSLRLGRPVSTIKPHMILTWIDVSSHLLSIRKEFPGITDKDGSEIARFGHITPSAWDEIKRSEKIVGALPGEALLAVDRAIDLESRTRSASPVSTELATQLMRAQRLSTKVLARILGLHDLKSARESTSMVRSSIFEGTHSPQLPWGVLAAVLSRDAESFGNLIKFREQEIAREYRRRGGHTIGEDSLRRKIWGEERSIREDQLEGLKVIPSEAMEKALKSFLRPFVLGTPSATMRSLAETRGQLPILKGAHSSYDRLMAIITGAAMPSYPEYKRFLSAGRVPPNELHAVGWRHAFGSHVAKETGATPFGLIQRRVIKTLLYEGYESRGEALESRDRHRLTAAAWFQSLEQKGDIPLVVAKRLCCVLGVPPKAPRYRAIESLLALKAYSAAIRDWHKKGMDGLTDAERRDVSHLLYEGQNISSERLFAVTETDARLLDVFHKFKAGSITAMPLGWKRTVRGVHTIMRMFPGATLDDIREVFATDGKALRTLTRDSAIPSRWVPRFENSTDIVLLERGILEAHNRPTLYVPPGIQRLRDRACRVLGSHVDRGSFLAVLFPARHSELRGDSFQLVEIARELINASSGSINLTNAQKAQLHHAFKEVLSVSPTFEECRVKLGAALADQADIQAGDTLSVRGALDRFLTFLVFGDSASDRIQKQP